MKQAGLFKKQKVKHLYEKKFNHNFVPYVTRFDRFVMFQREVCVCFGKRRRGRGYYGSVSYTHLTLPTNREV